MATGGATKATPPAADAARSAAAPQPIANLSFAGLDSTRQTELLQILADQFCPCGLPQSFADTLRRDQARCPLALDMARRLVENARRGLPRKDLVLALTEDLRHVHNRARFHLQDRPHLGPEPARVEVVVFSDFTCPYCAEAARPLAALVEQKGATLYYKFMPLPSHEHAELAARAAWAAHRQGKFWPMHDALFAHKADLSPELIDATAALVSLDPARYRQDRDDPNVARILKEDEQDAESNGVTGTPFVFVGGYPVEFEDLEAAVDREKQAPKAAPASPLQEDREHQGVNR